MKRILSTLLCVFCIAFISSCSKDSQKLVLLDTTWANDNSLVSVNKITFETSSMCTMRIGGTNSISGTDTNTRTSLSFYPNSRMTQATTVLSKTEN